jgi:hypothetical protein
MDEQKICSSIHQNSPEPPNYILSSSGVIITPWAVLSSSGVIIPLK